MIKNNPYETFQNQIKIHPLSTLPKEIKYDLTFSKSKKQP